MRNISLTGADGSVWDLCTGDVQVGQADPALWGMPPVGITERTSYAVPGSTVTGRRHGATDLVIPILVFPENPYTAESLVARLARALDPVAGDVTITVRRGDTTPARRITATYLAGWNSLVLAAAYSGDVEGKVALRATDPYWSSIVDETVTVTPPDPVFVSGTTDFNADFGFDAAAPFDGFFTGVGFDDPNTPFDQASPFDGAGGGTVIFTATNPGDVDAYPEFNVHGPAGWIEATNLSTGAFWSHPGVLGPMETLHITSRPGRRTVRTDGVNTYGQLGAGSQLWPLPPGESTIAVRFAGTTPTLSQFTMSWTPRYLTC